MHDNDNEVNTIVLQLLINWTTDLYEVSTEKLIECYNRCLNISGNFVKKLIKIQAFMRK